MVQGRNRMSSDISTISCVTLLVKLDLVSEAARCYFQVTPHSVGQMRGGLMPQILDDDEFRRAGTDA